MPVLEAQHLESDNARKTAGQTIEQQLLVISWNVAGFLQTHNLIKSHYGSFDAYLSKHQAAIFCVQETRCQSSCLQNLAESRNCGAVVNGFQSFWAFNEQKGARGSTNGVATWVREDIIAATGVRATQDVLSDPELDREGRCLLVELGQLVVLNVYAPFLANAGLDESKKVPSTTTQKAKVDIYSKKLRFFQLLQKRVDQMISLGKHVVICGDLNLTWRAADVAHQRRVIKIEDGMVNGDPKLSLQQSAKSDPLDLGPWYRVCDVHQLLLKQVTLGKQDAEELIRLKLSDDLMSKSGLAVNSKLQSNDSSSNHVCIPAGWRLHSVGTEGEPPTKQDSRTKFPCETKSQTLAALACSDDQEVTVTLEFEIPLSELARLGQPAHIRLEEELVEFMKAWTDKSSTLVDTFADCHPKAVDRFTCWGQHWNLRYSNCGARLDYILCDKNSAQFLVRTSTIELAGSSDSVDAHSSCAALNAATHFGEWHAAHKNHKGSLLEGEGTLSLQQDNMRLNDSQFRSPHTGIIYTPPRYSDHVPVCALFDNEVFNLAEGLLLISEAETRRCTPWVKQSSMLKFLSTANNTVKKQRVS